MHLLVQFFQFDEIRILIFFYWLYYLLQLINHRQYKSEPLEHIIKTFYVYFFLDIIRNYGLMD